MTRYWVFLSTLTLLLGAAGPAAAQKKCNLATTWSATTFEKEECMEHAEKALRKTGYYKNFSVSGQSVFGYNEEDEHASIRCLTSKGVVFFIVAGQGSLTDRVERIKRNY